MASKGKGRSGDRQPGILGGAPLGSVLDVVDGVGAFLFKMFLDRYEVEERIKEVKSDAARKAQEIKEEAVKTGYAVKKAFFRAIVEAVFLTTGLLALIAGGVLVVSDVVPLKYVLLGYGIAITAIVAVRLKTQP